MEKRKQGRMGDLPPGGRWVTIDGRHVYLVNGKVVAGHLPWEEKESKTEEHVPVFHGTKLVHAEKIKQEGFKLVPNTSEGGDMGTCVYFKSPKFDLYEREGKSDTVAVVNHFAKHMHRSKGAPAVIHCRIPKSKLLDLTKGRPAELEKLLNQQDHVLNDRHLDTPEEFKRIAYAYLTGQEWENVPKYIGLEDMLKAIDQLKTDKLFKDRLHEDIRYQYERARSFDISAYELYCCKHGIPAVVDKLDWFPREGWQIGVYNPSLIEIVDIGKELGRDENGRVKLVKSWLRNILKSVNKKKAKGLPYALLHVQPKGNYLHFFVGAFQDRVEKSVLLYVLV